MKRIAKFEKVSFEQFKNSIKGGFDSKFSDEEIKKMYDDIKIPVRATTGSAGYDFYAPFDFKLKPGEVIKIPTGIRAHIDDGWVLICCPRSGLGFKYMSSLANTIGVIDSDYYYSDNEGHIFIKLVNRSVENKTMTIKKGEGIIQGIFLPFGITVDDNSNGIRNGGFGSTTR